MVFEPGEGDRGRRASSKPSPLRLAKPLQMVIRRQGFQPLCWGGAIASGISSPDGVKNG